MTLPTACVDRWFRPHHRSTMRGNHVWVKADGRLSSGQAAASDRHASAPVAEPLERGLRLLSLNLCDVS